MNSEDVDDDMMRLLTKVVADEATPAERAQVDEWVAGDISRERMFRDLVAATESMEELPARYDSVPAWERLVARSDSIRPPAVVTPPEPRRAAAPAPPRWAFRSVALHNLRRAAAVVLLVGGGALAHHLLTRADAGPASPLAEFSVQSGTGEVRALTLADGSRIHLGPESSLAYSRAADGTRVVELTGLAYFDVAHETGNDFVVRAQGISTWVLGTRFVVRAYAGNPEVRVAVEEGKVSLGASHPLVVLGPGDVGEMGAADQPKVSRATKSERELAWTGGVLTFVEEPLENVVAELAYWYQEKVELGDSALAGRRITATLHRGDLADVLQPIALTLGARLEKRGDTYVFLSE